MKNLLELLKDGNSRTVEALAAEMGTSPEDINRRLEYLEHIGVIRRVSFSASKGCSGCSGCESGGAAACRGCIPENASFNMGDMWEVAK